MSELSEALNAIKELKEGYQAFTEKHDASLKELKENGHVSAEVEGKLKELSNNVGDIDSKLSEFKKRIDKVAAKSKIHAEGERSLRLHKRWKREGIHVKMFDEQGSFNQDVSQEYRNALLSYLVNSDNKTAIEEMTGKMGYRGNLLLKGLTIGSESGGGYLVHPELGALIEDTVAEFSPIHQEVDIVNISSDRIKYPTTNARVGASRATELGTRAETTAPTFGNIEIQAYNLYAKPFVSQDFLEDAAINVEQFLANLASKEFVITEADEIFNGDGTGGCRGVLTYDDGTTNATIEQVQSGSAAAIEDGDKILDLQNALKPFYRNGAKFYAQRGTFNTVRKLKDGMSNYIWQPGLSLQTPSMLVGSPVVEAEDVPAVAANALAMVYGNFRQGYKLVRRTGMRILRNPFTNEPEVSFTFTTRVGGAPVITEAFKILQIAA